jgi:long-chain acyl-CoA synthetase
MSKPERIVLTGATGFLGRELVAELLARNPETEFSLLVRGRDDAEAAQRADRMLTEVLSGDALANARKRVRAVRADLERERFGLEQRAYEKLAGETTAVIHGAASVSFSLPLPEARAINVEGTRRMLDFALRANARMDYIGTAYVAGERRGLVREDELDVGQSFRNTYEQTKMEAEKLVRKRAGGQPVVMYRPSIIVGDSETGRTSSFKVLYWPLKVYARGLVPVVPAKPRTPVDVVPSDYVVKAIAHIREDAANEGKCFHLAAGPERSARLEELSSLASEFFHVRKPIFVNPELFVRYGRPVVDRLAWGKVKHVLTTGRVYTPYMSLDMTFDTSGARRALAGTEIEVPPVERYFSRLFEFAIASDWGKRPTA